jgi:hypothetical protein
MGTTDRSSQQPPDAKVGDRSDGALLEEFVARREETAFAALVQRYGPLVYSVCRLVLRHVQDAEDAFQAAFLVLALEPGPSGRAPAAKVRGPEAEAPQRRPRPMNQFAG